MLLENKGNDSKFFFKYQIYILIKYHLNFYINSKACIHLSNIIEQRNDTSVEFPVNKHTNMQAYRQRTYFNPVDIEKQSCTD